MYGNAEKKRLRDEARKWKREIRGGENAEVRKTKGLRITFEVTHGILYHLGTPCQQERIFLRVPFWELKLGSIAARPGGKSKTRSLKPEGCGTRLRSSNAVGSSRGRTLQLRLPTQILQIRRRRASGTRPPSRGSPSNVLESGQRFWDVYRSDRFRHG